MAIYFIQDALDPKGLIKIGFSNNLTTRLAGLSQVEGFQVRVIAAIPGEYEQERYFHARFAHCRVRGEWFEPTDELLTLAHLLGVDDRLAVADEGDLKDALGRYDAELVDECIAILASLVDKELGGSRDTIDACLKRIANRLALPTGALWSLRYRPPRSISAGVYNRLRGSSAVAEAEAFLGASTPTVKP